MRRAEHKAAGAIRTAIALICVLPCLAGTAAGNGERVKAGHTVVIENVQFNPPNVTVRAGERILWVNKDLVPHTVTSATKLFDSGSIAPNASWSFVPRKAGAYPYGCTFHPTMKGTITVQ